MKILGNRRCAGILFILTILIPNMLIFPNKNMSQSLHNNYDFTIINSSNGILITRPITYFDNNSMILNITGVYASLNGLMYNGTTNPPDTAEYAIYREVDGLNMGQNGNLFDSNGDGEWNATNINVIGLNPGVYYVRATFEANGGSSTGISLKSNRFFVLGNLSVSAAIISYIDDMTQKINVTTISVDNTSSLDIFTYTIFDNELKANTSISGTLNYESVSQTWNASNIDVSNLPEGSYFVLGYFEDSSQNEFGIGNISAGILDLFTVNHTIEIIQLENNYTDQMAQTVTTEVKANTSYFGNGIGTTIQNNPNATVLCTIVNNSNSELTNINGLLTWNEEFSSWKGTLSTATLPEGVFYIKVNFSIISNSYNASTISNSTTFTVKHALSIYIPMPIFHSDNATLDIVGVVATDSYLGYHHINNTTVQSTYFELYNYSSKESLGLSGNLTYNPINDDWRNMSIDLSSYPEGLYFIYVNISSVDVPEGAISNSTSFELVHKIIISGIFLEYTSGFQQILNITVLSANSTYKYHSRENISHSNYQFYFKDNQTVVLTPDLRGNLTWTGLKWQAIADISKLLEGQYYVVVNFADPTAANSKGSVNTTNFTVIHTINVSTPTINYINNMDQTLNISCYVNSSYYYHRYFNSTNFGTGYYQIYLSNGTPTTITGSIDWNGENWVAINVDVSLLPVNSYRIKCIVSSIYAESNSSLSDTFNIIHTITISSPTVSFDNITRLLNITDVTACSSYSTYGYLTNLTALINRFEIFYASNETTGISEDLTWNGTEWQVINFDVSSLANGNYYVKIYFNDTQTPLTEISSEIFEVNYPEERFDWIVVIIIILLASAAVIVLFWLFFTETPTKRKKES
ncbi:MAG: hypothetical protein ACFFD2_03710 [Promethearchaeota archaeon]